MIVLLLFTIAYAGVTVRVTKDYAHPAGTVSEWITIPLDTSVTGKSRAVVREVTWCKAIQPTNTHLDDCRGAGLMHLQLYPPQHNEPESMIRILEDDPNTLYIDPIHIGGWDNARPFEVIIKANVEAGVMRGPTELVQVMRFNMAPSRVQVEEFVASASSSSSSSILATQNPASIDSVPAGPTQGQPQQQPVSTVPPHHVDDDGETVYNWPAALTLLVMGIILLAGIAMLQFTSLGSRVAARLRRHQQYRQLGGYVFANQQDIEMADLGHDKSVMPAMDEAEALRILKSLGTGAGPAFDANN